MINHHGSVLVTHAEGDDPEACTVALSDPRYWHEQACEGSSAIQFGDDSGEHVAPFYATEDVWGVRLMFCQACVDRWYGQRTTSEWTFFPAAHGGTVEEALNA